MTRKLTEVEKELTEKNLKKRIDKLELLKENLEYSYAMIEKNDFIRNFEDKWKPLVRKTQLKEEEDTIELIKSQIEEEESMINKIKDQLKNGVNNEKEKDTFNKYCG
jgi:hypothetical protein